VVVVAAVDPTAAASEVQLVARTFLAATPASATRMRSRRSFFMAGGA
jgi:hypothetical protein